MRFNFFRKVVNAVVNHEGAVAYKLSPEMELYSAVVTAGLSDSFYEIANTRLERIQQLMRQNEPEFIARLAVYARTKMNMRSVPLVLAVELAKMQNAGSVVSRAVKGVVNRADEITELLAYYQLANNRQGNKKLNKLSKQVQKGLGAAFNNFDEYQFSKYDRDGDVKLRDALFLVHPKAKSDDQQAIFNKIANRELATPYTWETELSALGQVKYESVKARSDAFRAKWEELIDSGKLGYMAMLRNLRNILNADVSAEYMEKVCNYIANEEAVAKSKQLPFRFLAAYREVRGNRSPYLLAVMDALESAAVASVKSMKGFNFNTRVLVACDVSGSMQKPISPNSRIQYYDIGLMLGMLLQSKCKAIETGMFGDNWKLVNLPSKNVLANVLEFYRREGEVGYATNGYKVIDDLVARQVRMDKVMLFTDCQLWDSKNGGNSLERSWKEYKKLFPEAKLYLFDLAGYGSTPLSTNRDDVYFVAGWSDKVFEVMEALEQGSSVVEMINSVVI